MLATIQTKAGGAFKPLTELLAGQQFAKLSVFMLVAMQTGAKVRRWPGSGQGLAQSKMDGEGERWEGINPDAYGWKKSQGFRWRLPNLKGLKHHAGRLIFSHSFFFLPCCHSNHPLLSSIGWHQWGPCHPHPHPPLAAPLHNDSDPP